jgi:hypothetical protein
MFKLLVLISLLFCKILCNEITQNRIPVSVLFHDINNVKIVNQAHGNDEGYLNYLPIEVSYNMIRSYNITYKGFEVNKNNMVVDYPKLNANSSKLLTYCSDCKEFSSEKEVKIVNFIALIGSQYLCDKTIKIIKMMSLVDNDEELEQIIDFFLVNGKFNILMYYNLFILNNDMSDCNNVNNNFCAYRTNFINKTLLKDLTVDIGEIPSMNKH